MPNLQLGYDLAFSFMNIKSPTGWVVLGLRSVRVCLQNWRETTAEDRVFVPSHHVCQELHIPH